MRIAVFGCGYVGLVTATCLAEAGHQVTGVDIDPSRVEALNRGQVPIFEPGLEVLLCDALADGRIRFTCNAGEAIFHSEVLFIAVGTASAPDGSADISQVLQVAATIGQQMTQPKLLVVKSTVPVGSCARVRATVEANQAHPIGFRVASNPEFLKEGAAVEDFKRPDRIIIGIDDSQAERTLRAIYAPFNRNRDKLVVMDITSSELTKYAANAMLATRISFMNELAGIAERTGADIERVRVGIGADPRIGYSFIYPGAGYGGSCFPKDIRALRHTAWEHGTQSRILDAVEAVNRDQKCRLFEMICEYFDGNPGQRTIALWGLAFKPNTDDIREAPSRVLMEALWNTGARVQAHDPKAMNEIRRLYADRSDDQLRLYADPYSALEDADLLVVVTEWKNYWNPDFGRIAASLKRPALFDGRNIYNPELVAEAGLEYFGIGRPRIRLATSERRVAA